MLPKITLSIERWKYNPTFELYVSNKGHIRNKSKADIAPKITQGGYVTVYCYGSLNRYMLLHRVVMLTWKPTPEAENLTVDHLDHNKKNNALSNLEWVTKEENLRRASKDYVRNSDLTETIFKETKTNKPKGYIVTKKASSRVEKKAKINGFYFDNNPTGIATAIDCLKKYDPCFTSRQFNKKIEKSGKNRTIGANNGCFCFGGFQFEPVES